jgi:cardiolipin synthase
MFIIRPGKMWNAVLNILKEKASQGVEIRLLYDDIGCISTLPTNYKKELEKYNIKCEVFNPAKPIVTLAHNNRDHRKIIVVDGKVAYTGGCNLADEYINAKQIHGYWKDTGVRIEGEAVDGLTLIFLRQWEVLSKTREDYSQFMKLSPPQNNANTVIPYADGLDYAHPIARGAYENLIASAEKFLFIMSPYFIVDDGITNLLINKALSGVEVKIFLPEIPDKKIVYTISRSNAEKLIDYGVKVYVVKNTFVHSKLMLTENCVAIGSVNMDLRSFYQQFECGVITDDQKVTKSVYLDFLQTQQNSLEINQKNKRSRNIFYRIFVGLMQVFAPLM